ncbi:MAG: hypothetical protein AAGH42_00010 [Pseudomonadota bacterium]
MTDSGIVLEIGRRVLVAFVWSGFAFGIAWLLSSGRILNNPALSLFTFLNIFSFAMAGLMGFLAVALARQKMPVFIAPFIGLAVGALVLFLVQSASVVLFDNLVSPIDRSIDVHHIDILPPGID